MAKNAKAVKIVREMIRKNIEWKNEHFAQEDKEPLTVAEGREIHPDAFFALRSEVLRNVIEGLE